MNPGRELDALVAEKVMGCKIRYITSVAGKEPWGCDCPGEPHAASGESAELKEYSTDIAAAWQVVEKLKLAVAPDELDENKWVAAPGMYLLDTSKACVAPTAPHAICLAALKAVGAL